MDKNTIYGMLMMGLVIFGFMYLNKGDQEKYSNSSRSRPNSNRHAKPARQSNR